MVILTPIERENLHVFLYISQTLNISTFGSTADIYTIIHTRVSISPSTRATAAVIRLRRHRQSSSRNFAYHFLILLKTGAAFWNSTLNRRCTVTTDEVLAYSKSQNDFSSLLNAIFATTTLS